MTHLAHCLLQVPLLMGGWASYPPVQDAGYDPSISPVRTDAGQALVRVVRPASHGPMRFGFIKRLNRIAAPTVKASFQYHLKPDVPGRSIEIGFAGADGHLYTAAPSGSPNATIEFPAIPPGTVLEAVYIVAVLPDADPEVEYRFVLSQFVLDAPVPPSFELRVPVVKSVPPWSALVSESTYAPGETISIDARAPIGLHSVQAVLENQSGQLIATRNLVRHGEDWKADLHTIRPRDTTGVWRIHLTGTTPGGSVLRSQVRVIVRPPRGVLHPRIFFSAADRADLVKRTQEPGLREVWKGLTVQARQANAKFMPAGDRVISLLDSRYLLPSLMAYFDVVSPASDLLRLTSLQAYVTGDSQAHAIAKRTLLAVARWSRWAPPWFEAHGLHSYYPEGELSMDFALAYDLLYPDLSESERVLARRALIEKGIRDPYREYVVDDRLIAGTSNWLGHSVGGALVAAMAVMDGPDDPELNRYLGGLLLKFEEHLAASYLSDGSYGESTGYEQFDLKSTTQALEALARAWGIDYWKHSFVKDSLQFPLYTLALPPAESPDMGDGHGQSAYSSAAIVRRSDDPAMRWYYAHFEHKSVLDFLFPPAPGAASIEQNVPSRIFDQKGFAVFRTGWKPGDVMLLFRAGPNFNHNHADQGAFLLRAFGEDLASEAGPSHYYNDPYYPTYFTQAAGHNTVLVNGDPASEDLGDTAQFKALHTMVRMTDAITSPSYDAAGAELSPVYRGRLEHYRRRIVFLKPSVVLIYDDLKAIGSPATYDWQLHVRDKDRLRPGPEAYLYPVAKGAMRIHPLYPDRPKIDVKDGHLPYATFSPAAPRTVTAQPGIFTLESGTGRFLVALELESGTNKPRVEKLEGEGCIGGQSGSTVTLFRVHRTAMAAYGAWRTDAETWTFAPNTLAAAQVTSIQKEGKPVFESDHPVTFAATLERSNVHLKIAVDQPTTIRWDFGATRELKLKPGRQELNLPR